VKAVLINIFGGIVRCDMVANGVVAAAIPAVPKAKRQSIEVDLQVNVQSPWPAGCTDGIRPAAGAPAFPPARAGGDKGTALGHFS
jgi:hypothetical protein